MKNKKKIVYLKQLLSEKKVWKRYSEKQFLNFSTGIKK